ncbi:MAG: DivIVA domain-containing protein [Deltaproteobacteria bacterium]|nr:DivIVA domain-containing protein [Deltaproteobacteria bacterium]
MKITPIDIRQQQFGKTFRGLDPREVDSFLNLISDELESVLRENNQLKEDIARTGRIVDEYRDRERALKETMITAQKITDDIKESARKEAEVILSQAELQAEKIIHAANDRLVKIIEDINEIKRQREQMHVNLAGLVKSHRRLLHEVDEDKMESVFVSVEELKQRRRRLHAAIQEALEAQASLLDLDRDHEIDDLREEVERLQRLRTNFLSRLQGVVDTHSKLLEAREEAEGKTGGLMVEDTSLKVLKRPEEKSEPTQTEDSEENQNSPASGEMEGR